VKLGIAGLTAVLSMSGGLGLLPAAAQTGPSYNGGNCPGGNTCTTWCPGDPLIPGSEFGVISWDWNVCHDWYWNSEGVVDIAANVVYRCLRTALRGRPFWPPRGAAASKRD
jgi:hypothetical protein